MPSPLLLEIREKINRAEQNITHLKQFLPGRELAENTGDVFTVERQPDGETHHIFVGPMGALALPLRLAVGDVIHDLRTSLDHLTYQLAVVNKFPLRKAERTPEQEIWFRRLNFMIHDRADRFDSRAGEVAKVIGKPPVAEMKRLQPYQALDKRGPMLWRLSELDNITKHRVIVAVDPQFRLAHVNIDVRSSEGHRTVTGSVAPPDKSSLKDRTQLFSFRVPVGQTNSPPKVDVHVKPIVEPVFADTDGLCDGANIFRVMRDSVSTVSTVIDDFDKAFF